MRKAIYTLFTIITFASISGLLAAEIDSFTLRHKKLPNSLKKLNKTFNKRIAEGVKQANKKNLKRIKRLDDDEFCSETILFKELRKAIFKSKTAGFGLKGYSLDKQMRKLLKKSSHKIALKDSIYRDYKFFDGISLKMKELSSTIQVEDNIIGVDKIGHFFAEGWKYFEFTNDEEESIEDAIQWGEDQERGKFGYRTTGVFSYADLATNLNGWRFWNRFLYKENDPLIGSFSNIVTRAYVKCVTDYTLSIKHRRKVKKWKYKKNFDFRDFVDQAWDEGINCNSYRNSDIEEKVVSRISELKNNNKCPIRPDSCRELRGKYGNYYARFILHPFCQIYE
jgi:hypothetical protein